MGDLTELLKVDMKIAFNFFHSAISERLEHLPREIRPSTNIIGPEIKYISSILAHYSLTSSNDPNSLLLSSPIQIFDTFIVDPTLQSDPGSDPELMETAGSLVLLHAGYFREQFPKRYNMGFYDGLGQQFFLKASHGYGVAKENKSLLLQKVSENLPFWNQVCSLTARDQKDSRFILRLQ